MGLHGAGSRLPGVSITSMFSVRGRSVTYDRVRRRRLIFAYSEVPRSGQRPRMRDTTVSKPSAPRLLVLDTVLTRTYWWKVTFIASCRRLSPYWLMYLCTGKWETVYLTDYAVEETC
jgi:hypothetical protein